MKIQNKVNRFWDSDADGEGRLNPQVINTVFKEVCSQAGVEGHTPPWRPPRHGPAPHWENRQHRGGSKAARPHQRGLFHPVRQGHRPGTGRRVGWSVICCWILLSGLISGHSFCRQFELTILSGSGVFYKSGQKDIFLGSSFAKCGAIWNGRRVGLAFVLKVFRPGGVGKDKDSFCRLNNESKLRFW